MSGMDRCTHPGCYETAVVVIGRFIRFQDYPAVEYKDRKLCSKHLYDKVKP